MSALMEIQRNMMYATPPHEDGNGFHAAIQRQFWNMQTEGVSEGGRRAFRVISGKVDDDIFLFMEKKAAR